MRLLPEGMMIIWERWYKELTREYVEINIRVYDNAELYHELKAGRAKEINIEAVKR